MINALHSPKTHIFFHMGPGLHAQIERSLFEKTYPHVLFADQPYDQNFGDICIWAQNLIKETFHKSGSKITLLGHSFGAQILANSMGPISHMIEEVRILNSPFHSLDAFISLEQELYPQTALGRDYWHQRSLDEKMHLLFKVGSDPKINSFYWRCNRSRVLYETVSVGKPGLNISSFLKVYMDYLGKAHSPILWEGRVSIRHSAKDALIATQEMVEGWKSVFPKADGMIYPDGGHYLHIENPEVASWFFTK